MQSMTVKKAILDNIFSDALAYSRVAHFWDEEVPLSIDSRSMPKNGIFFAIKGELNDGHDFISEAQNKGALLIIAEREVESFVPIIIVKDSLKLFSLIAHNHLMSMPAFRIGLTGSNGKTTVKEMIRAALSALIGPNKVYANVGTLNNHFGVPISALLVKPEHSYAVFEMGMNHEGEIRDLCEIVKPQLGLIINIGVAHEGNFKNGPDGVQAAKGELFYATQNKIAVVNLDDTRVMAEAKRHDFSKVISFGTNKEADLWLKSRGAYDVQSNRQKILIEEKDGSSIEFYIPLPGYHHAKNAVAALAVVKALGLSIKDAAQGLSSMITTTGRMNLNLVDGCLVINDAYNANPVSMKAGILACLEFEAPRRIAVIGAMGELGTKSREYHFELGQTLAKYFHRIFISGEDALAIVEGAKAQGFDPSSIIFKKTSEELIEPVRAVMPNHDLIFIKGSKTALMQVVARALIEKR